MKSLELKALKMNDNFPLIISLNGKVEWELDDNKDIVDSHLVNRDDARCTFSTISQTMLYPSSDKAKIRSTLNYFFNVCDESLSPQCMWGTDDCDYMSLFLEYHIYSEFEFDKNVEKMINMFPELLHSENVLLDIPKDKKIKNLVYMIEVAYPVTWTIDFIEYDELCGMKFNSIKLKSYDGVSLLVRTDKDNVLYDYVVEVITKDGNHAYGCGDDLDVALATFNEYVESSSC